MEIKILLKSMCTLKYEQKDKFYNCHTKVVEQEIASGKRFELLKYLFSKSQPLQVFTITETQSKIAKDLGISRQALSMHLKKMRELGLIRTGRGFIDLTEKALQLLGRHSGEAIITIKIDPSKRPSVYSALRKLPVEKAYRVTGDIDAIIQVSQALLESTLNAINSLEGVRETRTYIIIEAIK